MFIRLWHKSYNTTIIVFWKYYEAVDTWFLYNHAEHAPILRNLVNISWWIMMSSICCADAHVDNVFSESDNRLQSVDIFFSADIGKRLEKYDVCCCHNYVMSVVDVFSSTELWRYCMSRLPFPEKFLTIVLFQNYFKNVWKHTQFTLSLVVFPMVQLMIATLWWNFVTRVWCVRKRLVALYTYYMNCWNMRWNAFPIMCRTICTGFADYVRNLSR